MWKSDLPISIPYTTQSLFPELMRTSSNVDGSTILTKTGRTISLVVSPRARRAMARYAMDRGLSQRRSAWLCSTPRSAIYYRSKRERRDRHLSSALRLVARGDPAWGYRLAAGYLRLRGWQVNDKRAYRLWRLNGLCLPPYRASRKIRSGARLAAWRCDATTSGPGISSTTATTTQSRCAA